METNKIYQLKREDKLVFTGKQIEEFKDYVIKEYKEKSFFPNNGLAFLCGLGIGLLFFEVYLIWRVFLWVIEIINYCKEKRFVKG